MVVVRHTHRHEVVLRQAINRPVLSAALFSLMLYLFELMANPHL
jgi:hypothetical protein